MLETRLSGSYSFNPALVMKELGDESSLFFLFFQFEELSAL